MLVLAIQMVECLVIHMTHWNCILKVWVIIASYQDLFWYWLVRLLSALVLLCIHIFNISTSDFNAKLTAMEHILKVLSYHGQIDAQISTNSGQIRPKDPQEHKEKLQVPCYSKFCRKEMITSFTWHEMRQFQQPHLHYTVIQLSKLAKSGSWHCPSSMAMYSVMRDIPDARKVPIERGWVALHLYATCKFSNHLTLEQWAFEYGLPLFWYAL